jgi:hypothetical protein
MSEEKPMAQFETGATRNRDENKFDYEGFLSPRVIERYGEYMNSHRLQKDGTRRDSDNWQLGIPIPRYMKSLWRHFFDVWKLHRGLTASDPDSGKAVDLETALCGVIFNASGMLHETIKLRTPKAFLVSEYKDYSTFSEFALSKAGEEVMRAVIEASTKKNSVIKTRIRHLKDGSHKVRHTRKKKGNK